MTMIRYSDDDRARMRQDDEARAEQWRRDQLFFEFRCETGRVGIADRTPVSREASEKIGRLDLRWRDRHTQD